MFKNHTLTRGGVVICFCFLALTSPAVSSGQSVSFVELLNEANRIVLSEWPDAQFYQAYSDLSVVSWNVWTFSFNIPTNRGTVTIKSSFGRFQPPHFSPGIIYDDLPIDVSTINYEPAQAIEQAVKEGQGCGTDLRYITLRYVLYPGVTEPTFILTSPTLHKRAFVGVNPPHKVKCQTFAM